MPNYSVQTIASAPEGSKSALEQLKKAFGVVPNISEKTVLALGSHLLEWLTSCKASDLVVHNAPTSLHLYDLSFDHWG